MAGSVGGVGLLGALEGAGPFVSGEYMSMSGTVKVGELDGVPILVTPIERTSFGGGKVGPLRFGPLVVDLFPAGKGKPVLELRVRQVNERGEGLNATTKFFRVELAIDAVT